MNLSNHNMFQRKRVLVDSVDSEKEIKKVRYDAIDFERLSPVDYVFKSCSKKDFDIDLAVAKANEKFSQPTEKMLAAYNLEITRAVRGNDLKKLKLLHDSGAYLHCCNKFGDSLVHLACRRGLTSIVKFLVEDAKVSVYVRDELRRNPLHDACWTSKPNFEIVDILIRVAPELIFLPDSRGDTPFAYVRKVHWKQWLEFLSLRLTRLQSSIDAGGTRQDDKTDA